MRSILKEIKLSSVLLLLLGSAILAFGLYNIHSMSNVTEGGILGLTLLLEYWFGISPSVSGFVLTILCYFFYFFKQSSLPFISGIDSNRR